MAPTPPIARHGLLVAVLAAWLATITLAAPAPRAQPVAASPAPRIGYLGYTTAAIGAPYLRAFRQRLAELGLVDGRDLVVVERYAEGRYDRIAELCASCCARAWTCW